MSKIDCASLTTKCTEFLADNALNCAAARAYVADKDFDFVTQKVKIGGFDYTNCWCADRESCFTRAGSCQTCASVTSAVEDEAGSHGLFLILCGIVLLLFGAFEVNQAMNVLGKGGLRLLAAGDFVILILCIVSFTAGVSGAINAMCHDTTSYAKQLNQDTPDWLGSNPCKDGLDGSAMHMTTTSIWVLLLTLASLGFNVQGLSAAAPLQDKWAVAPLLRLGQDKKVQAPTSAESSLECLGPLAAAEAKWSKTLATQEA